MSKQRYPEEFKTEAVKQITDRGQKVADVSARLGVSQHSLYQRINARQMSPVTEERNILKRAAAYFARQSG